MKRDTNQAIIVRRYEEAPEAEGHGGGWKVAYADFMTAMMAFFLLMWIIAASDEEKVRGLADYFTPSVVTADGAGKGLLKGEAMDGKGTRGAPDAPPAPNQPSFGQENPLAVFDSRLRDTDPKVVVEYEARPESDEHQPAPPQDTTPVEPGQEDTPEGEIAARETAERKEDLEALRTSIEEQIEKSPEIAELADHMRFDLTPEGLQIQVVDHERRSMFASGSAQIAPKTRDLIGVIGKTIREMPNPVVVTGHTDAVPFRGGADYGNWELSADRANATRRVLLGEGVDPERIVRISGLADTDPLDDSDPLAPENRRISVLLRYPTPGAGSDE